MLCEILDKIIFIDPKVGKLNCYSGSGCKKEENVQFIYFILLY